MGMYTELFLSVQIKPDDEQVIEIIEYMIGETSEKPATPDHPFFATDRWHFMLRSSSHYFVPMAVSRFALNSITKNWLLVNRSDFKNYSGEVELLMDWLDHHIDAMPGEMLGYSRYEEADDPTILRKRGE